ncbi:hypothetical protein QTG54_008287 [Skeletonema marinoi]|uniref:DEAD/DEAH-box helicase domain-containing protein n=1 Tax=Skeletonema marinoi TaxID=267567 RepID=A0AAD8Y9P6_9STRA|nr:hypothetical protein QTG54_008287 [Skeletonema marinoi]
MEQSRWYLHQQEELLVNISRRAATLYFTETIHPSSVHAITHKLKLERMTEIQYKTFDAASTGSDVLARARTGTGKTLAFLVPGIQSALRSGRMPGRMDILS